MGSDVLEMPGKPRKSRKALATTVAFWVAVLLFCFFFLRPGTSQRPYFHQDIRILTLVADVVLPIAIWLRWDALRGVWRRDMAIVFAACGYLNAQYVFAGSFPKIAIACVAVWWLGLALAVWFGWHDRNESRAGVGA